jgi:hypothetical protein
MRFRLLPLAAFAILAAFVTSAPAQEAGPWRASSTTAKSITGDIFFSPLKITINFTTGGGNIFRVDIPADKRFLHKNTLCGSSDTQWIVTYAQGHDLQVAFFSGATPPVLTFDALNNAPSLCGVFSYIR